MPCFLRLDNELSFRGSNRHPRGLGLLLRTALSLNVVPIFIPVSEPWRNGVIEWFNQKVEDTLLTQEHNNFEELCSHAQQFVQTHNQEHHYSTMGDRLPRNLTKSKPVLLNLYRLIISCVKDRLWTAVISTRYDSYDLLGAI